MAGFCNLPERVMGNRNGGVCQWPRGSVVKWKVVKSVPGFSIDDLTEICRNAWGEWEAVSGFRAELHANPRTANVIVGSRRIDGPSGVLAEAQLPCGGVTSQTQLQVWFDTGDHWANSRNPGQGRVDIYRVAIHEFGHSCGMGHARQNSNSIMAPSISSIRSPQEWEIDQMVERYGEAGVDPVDPTPADQCTRCIETFAKAFNSPEGRRLMSATAKAIESFI